MFKKVMMVTMMAAIMVAAITGNGSVKAEGEETEVSGVGIKTEIISPYPEDFYEDIKVVFKQDEEVYNTILTHDGGYKDRIIMEPGIYEVNVELMGDLQEFYYVSVDPEVIIVDGKGSNVTVTVEDNVEKIESVVIDTGEEQIDKARDEFTDKLIKTGNLVTYITLGAGVAAIGGIGFMFYKIFNNKDE